MSRPDEHRILNRRNDLIRVAKDSPLTTANRILELERKLAVAEATIERQQPDPRLVEATEHLLDHHDCDCHGYENYQQAAVEGRAALSVDEKEQG